MKTYLNYYKEVKKIKIFILIIKEILKNFIMYFPIFRKIRKSHGIAYPCKSNLNRYLFKFFNQLKNVTKNFNSFNIIEYGPGDNLITGLAFLASGARSYSFVDRFPRDYNSTSAKKWYYLVKENWKFKWPEDLDVNNFPNKKYSVTPILVPIERFNSKIKYDLICSNFVGEHVINHYIFVDKCIYNLSKYGKSIHVIDFSGHQINKSGDPLLFLRFPEVIWKLMSSNRGMPNRIRFSEYKKTFLNAAKKYNCKLTITGIKRQKLNTHDPLLKRYSVDDLEICEATFIIQKI
jgi:hypothetical protein